MIKADKLLREFLLENNFRSTWESAPAVNEDVKKKSNGKWVNKGKSGEHGQFKTKKAALAQTRAMYANGYKEDLNELLLNLLNELEEILGYLSLPTIKYLDSAIASSLRKTGRVDVTGSKVNNAKDLANLFTIFRDSRYETFRVIYVKNQEVVGTDNITSRLPHKTNIYKYYGKEITTDEEANLANKRTVEDLRRKKLKLEADGYYLLHNHPTGDVSVAQLDIKTTLDFSRNIDGLLAHIIMGYDKFTVIYPDLQAMTYSLEDNPVEDKKDLGTVRDKHSLVDLARRYTVDKDFSLIVYSNSKYEVRAVQEIYNPEFKNKQLYKYFYNLGIENGSPRVFLITDNPSLFFSEELLQQTSVFTDILLVTGRLVLSMREANLLSVTDFDTIRKTYNEKYSDGHKDNQLSNSGLSDRSILLEESQIDEDLEAFNLVYGE